jgi:hypothetical protein
VEQEEFRPASLPGDVKHSMKLELHVDLGNRATRIREDADSKSGCFLKGIGLIGALIIVAVPVAPCLLPLVCNPFNWMGFLFEHVHPLVIFAAVVFAFIAYMFINSDHHPVWFDSLLGYLLRPFLPVLLKLGFEPVRRTTKASLKFETMWEDYVKQVTEATEGILFDPDRLNDPLAGAPPT